MRLLAAALLVVGTAQAAERPARSRLCPDDLPDGVHLPPPPSCAGTARKPTSAAGGFRDLGDGTSLRIDGRVEAGFGARR